MDGKGACSESHQAGEESRRPQTPAISSLGMGGDSLEAADEEATHSASKEHTAVAAAAGNAFLASWVGCPFQYM